MIRNAMVPVGFLLVLCTDVRIDQVAYLDCLSEMFRAAAQPGLVATVPNQAALPAPALGTYNQTAIREMLGQNFGRSIAAQRPARLPPAHFPR